ncbi:hypothetical protein AKO1_006527 [Acrasis kona]|uniref:3-isopropylmalate dehydratase small subunit n=1 Tax=Acrasis kona TaxID=1008807 RepID=A0AAW2ZIM8_9EUKA
MVLNKASSRLTERLDKLKTTKLSKQNVKKTTDKNKISKTHKTLEKVTSTASTIQNNAKDSKSKVKKALLSTATNVLGLNINDPLRFQVPEFPKVDHDIIRKDETIDPNVIKAALHKKIYTAPSKDKSIKKPEPSEKPSFFAFHQEAINKDNSLPGLFFMSPCSNQEKKEDEDMMTDKDPSSDPGKKMQALRRYGWGDRWTNEAITCRCAKCELKHIATKSSQCKVFLLVDLDNWGMIPMSSNTTYKSMSQFYSGEGSDHMFIWAMHGSGFRAHLEPNYKAIYDKVISSNDDYVEVQNSMFGYFKKKNHLRVSPTGSHKQSSDLAILNVIKLLRDRVHLIVITKDKQLLSTSEKIHSGKTGTGKLLTINPDTHVNVFKKAQEFYNEIK